MQKHKLISPRCFHKLNEKQRGILMFGLGAVVKTTILEKLKLGEIVTATSSTGFIVETLEYQNVMFTAWDVLLTDYKVPSQWMNSLQNIQGLVFVVDCNDKDRDRVLRACGAFGALSDMLNMDLVKDAVLLVFANKQDLKYTMNAAKIT